MEAIIGIITRHPMRQDELERTLDHRSPDQVRKALADLQSSGRTQILERYGTRFWSASPAHYPEKNRIKDKQHFSIADGDQCES